MTIPNFSGQYDDLSGVQSDPRFMLLCTQQLQELSKMTAKFAQERVRLAIAISKEAINETPSSTRPEQPIPRPSTTEYGSKAP